GALTTLQHEDSLSLADVLTETVLSLQDAAPDGVLAAGLDDAVAYRAEIHQAAGMVSIQLGVSPHDGLSAIRAYAFAHGVGVDKVAADIVSRRLRLTDGGDPTREGE
ncbi:MAG TPA: ANTAR domain-containing protein, partial [Ilumatobacter sp.]